MCDTDLLVVLLIQLDLHFTSLANRFPRNVVSLWRLCRTRHFGAGDFSQQVLRTWQTQNTWCGTISPRGSAITHQNIVGSTARNLRDLRFVTAVLLKSQGSWVWHSAVGRADVPKDHIFETPEATRLTTWHHVPEHTTKFNFSYINAFS
jgi:hypothetical protein